MNNKEKKFYFKEINYILKIIFYIFKFLNEFKHIRMCCQNVLNVFNDVKENVGENI